MIRPDDIQIVAIALQDYERQAKHYHFYNWELEELERCENEIRKVIAIYEDNLSDLCELISQFPSIEKYVPKEKIQQIQMAFQAQSQNKGQQFYALNGEPCATIEEALAKNEHLMALYESNKR